MKLLRVADITKPNGHWCRAKIYKDAKAGLLTLRKIGGATVVFPEDYAAYMRGQPLRHAS